MSHLVAGHEALAPSETPETRMAAPVSVALVLPNTATCSALPDLACLLPVETQISEVAGCRGVREPPIRSESLLHDKSSPCGRTTRVLPASSCAGPTTARSYDWRK